MRLRKRNALFVIILLVLLISVSKATIFQEDFSNGTFYRTFYNSSGFVQLNISQSFTVGNFSSRVFDAGLNSTWNNISWTTELCYGCELTDRGAYETGDFLRPLNMSGNVLLIHLNEQTGNITDYSIYSNNGTPFAFEGTEYGFSGKFNTSLDFENTGGIGPGEMINFSDIDPLDVSGNQLTLEAWINPESFTSSPTVIDKDPSKFSMYFVTAPNRMRVDFGTSSGSTTITGVNAYTANSWYHVVFTYNGSNIKLYRNGVLDGNAISKTGNIITNAKNLIIGSGWNANDPNAFPFDGLIDEVAVYNRSLSAQEISDRYLRGALRLNLSVRSCDDSSCSGENYTQIFEKSPKALSVTGNRYFQYKFDFNTENISFTPKLYNVSIDYLQTNYPPIMNLTYPLNNLNYSISQTALNYTAIDTDLSSCWYTLDNGLTNNTVVCGQNITNALSNEGLNTWRVYANDTSNNIVESNVSFRVDSTPPLVIILTPLNNSLLTNTTVYVNYSALDSGVGLNRCYWTNSSGVTNNTIACGTNFSFIGHEGINSIRIYANDTLGNLNSTDHVVNLNLQVPMVNITYPFNNTNYSLNQTALNYTAIDTDLSSCWYTLDNGLTNNTVVCGQNITNALSNEGLNTWRVYANDTSGAESYKSISFFLDTQAPTINILSPLNNSLLTNTTVYVNYSALDSGVGLNRCYWTNSSGVTNNTIACGTNFSFIGHEGINSIRIYANDTLGNLNSKTNTFNINTQAPTVTIFSPLQASVVGSLDNINLNYSAVDPQLQSCWYFIEEITSNITLSGCQNATFNLPGQGIFTLRLYANDSGGNVGYVSSTFIASTDSPSINTISPIDSYLNAAGSQNVAFLYTPTDLDLRSCSLWTNSTGSFVVNQTNYTVTSGQPSSFQINMTNTPEGAYLWAVLCNDSLNHNSITSNNTFYIDRTKPNVVFNEPSGTYQSLSNIPLNVSYNDASPVKCFYNVTRSTGNVEIPNTELINCQPTTFSLDIQTSYFIWMNVNDSAGNYNISRNSFTISVPQGNSGSGNSGGSSGGGGGGGGGSFSLTGRPQFEVELEKLQDLRINRGSSESIELGVSNKGVRFLNNCYFSINGAISEWISSEDVYSLSPGESIDYIFNVNAPIDADVGDYFVSLGVMCRELNSSFTYKVSVIGGEFELNILKSERIGTRLKASYSIENFGKIDKKLNINYKLLDIDGDIISEGVFNSVDIKKGETVQKEGEFELPKNSIGDYALIIEASDGIDTSERQQIVKLSRASISGFAISGNNLKSVAWFAMIIVLSLGIFIVVKIIKNQLAIKRAIEVDRQFITIDLMK